YAPAKGLGLGMARRAGCVREAPWGVKESCGRLAGARPPPLTSAPSRIRRTRMPAKAKTTYGEPERGTTWMAGGEANLEKATGKSLAQWVKIAKTCPHEKLNDRLKWFKATHGLGMARAGLILEKAFGSDAFGWGSPEQLVDNLFSKSFEPQRTIYDA